MRNQYFTMRQLNNGIIESVINSGVHITLEISQQEILMIKTMSLGKACPLLIDIRNLKSVSKESRKYYMSDDVAHIVSAVSLIIENPLSHIIGHFFLGLNKPKFPVRLFYTKEDALKWLEGYI